jgi:hypothetical protein
MVASSDSSLAAQALSDETDITYLTPYWWIEKQVKAKFPGCFLYDVV